MKDGLRVALCQIDVVSLDLAANRATMEKFFREACDVDEKPDIVVFPELANSGYVFQRGRDFGHDFLKAAEPIPGWTYLYYACKALQRVWRILRQRPLGGTPRNTWLHI